MTAAPRRLDARQLKTMRDLGRALTLIDVRPRHEFDAEHLPGAVNVPFGEHFDDAVRPWLDRPGDLVVYGEPYADEACARLGALGHPRVRCLDRGIAGWKRAGMPMAA